MREKLTRRRLLQAGGALGASMVLGGTTLAAKEYDQGEQSPPRENLSFPVGLEITDSDWGSILQDVEEDRDRVFSVRPTIYSGLPLWKFKIAIIDQGKADEIHTDECDWQYVPENIERLKDEQEWDALTKYTASAIVTFPDKADEIHALINSSRKEMIATVHDPSEDYYLTTDFPQQGFYLQNILGQKVNVPGKKWNEFTKRMNDTYSPDVAWYESKDYERYADYFERFANVCAWTKHFALDKLPDYYFYYPDSIVRPPVRDVLQTKAYDDRTVKSCDGTIIGDWWRFTDHALTARMLELDTIKMTPGGLVLA